MKNSLLLISLLYCSYSFSQKVVKNVDSKNYYDFCVNPKTATKLKGRMFRMNWLRKDEALPIILEELSIANHKHIYEHSLFKLDSCKYIVLSAYSRKANFGFLYIEGHYAFPKKEHRENITKCNGMDYRVYIDSPNGKTNFISIEKFPENVFILNENCYWYQSTDNPSDNKYFITKEKIKDILRQDIKNYLSRVIKKED